MVTYPRLYIGKICQFLKKSDIYTAFSNFGEIIDIMMKDDYAFIEYENVV